MLASVELTPHKKKIVEERVGGLVAYEYECSKCDRTYATKGDRELHLRIEHSNTYLNLRKKLQ